MTSKTKVIFACLVSKLDQLIFFLFFENFFPKNEDKKVSKNKLGLGKKLKSFGPKFNFFLGNHGLEKNEF